MPIHWTDFPELVDKFDDLLSILDTFDRHDMEAGFTEKSFAKESTTAAYTVDFQYHQPRFNPRLDRMPGLERLLDHFAVKTYPLLTSSSARYLRGSCAKELDCGHAALDAMTFTEIADALDAARRSRTTPTASVEPVTGAIKTFGDFLADARSVEECAASARAVADAMNGEPGTGSWRVQAAVFEATAAYRNHPSFPRLEAYVNEHHGAFTYDHLLRVRGKLCSLLHCGTTEVDHLSVEEAVTMLHSPAEPPPGSVPPSASSARRVNTCPKSVEPPRQFVEAAMRAVPSALNNAPEPQGVCDPANRRGADYATLRGQLETQGHNRDAAEWAIHRHVEAGRLEATPGFTTTPGVYRDGGWAMKPVTNHTYDRERCALWAAPELWAWWDEIESPPAQAGTLNPSGSTTLPAWEPPAPPTLADIRDLLRYKREFAQYEAWCRSTFKPFLGIQESANRAASMAFNCPQPGRLREEEANALAVYRRLLRDSLKELGRELDESALLYFVGEVADRHTRPVEKMWRLSTEEFGRLMQNPPETIPNGATSEVRNAPAEAGIPSEPVPTVINSNDVSAVNSVSGDKFDRKEGGRPKLGEGPNATPQDKALRNVYELVRGAVQPGWGPKSLVSHFRENKDFKQRVKDAGKDFDESLFKNALAWIKENPSQETESGNVS